MYVYIGELIILYLLYIFCVLCLIYISERAVLKSLIVIAVWFVFLFSSKSCLCTLRLCFWVHVSCIFLSSSVFKFDLLIFVLLHFFLLNRNFTSFSLSSSNMLLCHLLKTVMVLWMFFNEFSK